MDRETCPVHRTWDDASRARSDERRRRASGPATSAQWTCDHTPRTFSRPQMVARYLETALHRHDEALTSWLQDRACPERVTSGGLGPMLRRQVGPRQRTSPAARVAARSGHEPT